MTLDAHSQARSIQEELEFLLRSAENQKFTAYLTALRESRGALRQGVIDATVQHSHRAVICGTPSSQFVEQPMVKTAHGVFSRDAGGLWHYWLREEPAVSLLSAAEDAVSHRPEGAALFWFSCFPTQILVGDIAESLAKRWDTWRNDFSLNPRNLLSHLLILSAR
ncbi:MAG: hypothetical protein A3D67_01695 [Candidatus Lloydbacteria bacterium RIFCSPHIGHO2_02_FULL_51_22]|uniref:Uncharacterized protein n=2 Tax=Candidatus Lloydiibacteriota TaxID=1817910 RepID=A0A1G2DFT4_9BACT|nr:MAG: hypothetical protein A3D67_01695 [Candidatus Lloydbacteria bacterium RIFCSPHIGHO2_02_FULL_51_22]OGZ14760.1 MAG: hypothetical protein A3J08_04260 [Candidatus Lloydbacteria bacterium RIFCSPLOWO2_02_FULL_51_11]